MRAKSQQTLTGENRKLGARRIRGRAPRPETKEWLLTSALGAAVRKRRVRLHGGGGADTDGISGGINNEFMLFATMHLNSARQGRHTLDARNT